MSGIKITFAIDSNGSKVSAESYGSFPITLPLICPDHNCDACVEHVNGYKRESYGKQQFIADFFRLDKGFNHSEYCQYRTAGVGTIFAGDSDFEVQDALAKGELLFRVHVMDADEVEKLKIKAGQFQLNPPTDTTERNYKQKGRKATYVRSMNSLFEIYKYGVSNRIARDKIRLVIGGREVKWVDFFYSTNHLGSLRRRLQQERYVQAAAIVDISVLGLPNAKLGGFTYVECSPKTTGHGPSVYLTIKLSKKMSVNYFKLNQRTIILGKFSIPDSADRVTPLYLGNEIRTLISNEQQIFEV